MISQKKRLEVANIMYACVSGEFALFCNPKMRGPNFDWAKFPDMQERDAFLNLQLQNYKLAGYSGIENLAKEYAREIAERLVSRAGFLDKEQS